MPPPLPPRRDGKRLGSAIARPSNGKWDGLALACASFSQFVGRSPVTYHAPTPPRRSQFGCVIARPSNGKWDGLALACASFSQFAGRSPVN